MERVLVACPTFEPKDYCLDDWWAAYKAFRYAAREPFMVDNTPGTLDYLYRIRGLGIPAVHVEPMMHPYHTLELCWREIVHRAAAREFDWVASIEVDTICPPETLDTLLLHSLDRDVIGHGYPTRGAWQGDRMLALGCTLIRTSWLVERIDLWVESPEAGIWRGARRIELDGLLDTKHLDPPEA